MLGLVERRGKRAGKHLPSREEAGEGKREGEEEGKELSPGKPHLLRQIRESIGARAELARLYFSWTIFLDVIAGKGGSLIPT